MATLPKLPFRASKSFKLHGVEVKPGDVIDVADLGIDKVQNMEKFRFGQRVASDEEQSAPEPKLSTAKPPVAKKPAAKKPAKRKPAKRVARRRAEPGGSRSTSSTRTAEVESKIELEDAIEL